MKYKILSAVTFLILLSLIVFDGAMLLLAERSGAIVFWAINFVWAIYLISRFAKFVPKIMAANA